MGYRFVDHTADVAAEISGKSYEELFTSAFLAWADTAFEEIVGSSRQEIKFRLTADSAEELLHGFLDELNYLISVKKIAVTSVKNILIGRGNKFSLEVSAEAVSSGAGNIALKSEIKAVTFHRMEIVESGGVLSTLIVFDI